MHVFMQVHPWVFVAALMAVVGLLLGVAWMIYHLPPPTKKKTSASVAAAATPVEAAANQKATLGESFVEDVRIYDVEGELVVYPCGHTFPACVQISIYGEVFPHVDHREMCGDCFVAFLQSCGMIRCVLCGLSIMPGESVALYDPSCCTGLRTDIGHKVGGGYLGCLRMDCCVSGIFFVGHWGGTAGFYPVFEGGRTIGQVKITNPGAVVVHHDE